MSVGLCQSSAKGKGKGEKKQKIQRTKKPKSPKKRNPKNQQQKQNHQKNRLMKVTKIGFLGVSFFFGFLVFWFLVFWFVVGFLKGWQNNTKVKDLDLTLCQFSHFRGANLLLVDFIGCFGPVVPLENHVKNPWQNAGITGGSLGAWDTD